MITSSQIGLSEFPLPESIHLFSGQIREKNQVISNGKWSIRMLGAHFIPVMG